MTNRHLVAVASSALALALVVAGCDDKVVSAPAGGAPPPKRGAAGSASSAAASSSAPPVVFGEADFTASDRNRDPFRSYPELFVADPSEKNTRTQQKVVADRFSLDELKLVGIITGGTNARAMFVDPDGKGWIVTLGQLVGRSELVKAGGSAGAEYDLNWRVDRIREGDVVFVRENPGRANVPTATRVVALRPEGDQQAAARRRLVFRRRLAARFVRVGRGPSVRDWRSRGSGRGVFARAVVVTHHASKLSVPTTWPECRTAAYDRERVRRDRA